MTKIFIEGYELDLTQGLTNQITYAIDDLQNLDSKSTSFTKTIVLPGTTNNNRLLGNIFEFNNSNFYNPSAPNVLYNFNASKNAAARIEVNGLQIMKGVIRLIEIIQDGEAIEYECALFGELGGFINSLGNKRLQDLDFSAYNHLLNYTNITNSWSNTSSSGYVYPLIDYGNVSTGVYGTAKKDFQFNAFKPALFVKEYIDKIFANTPYTYECSFFDTAAFKRLIIPNNQAVIQKNSNSQLDVYPIQTRYRNSNGGAFDLELGTVLLGSFTLDPTHKILTYTGTTKTVNLNFTIYGRWIVGPAAYIRLKRNSTNLYSQALGTGSGGNDFSTNYTIENLTINNGDVFRIAIEWAGTAAYDMVIYSGQLLMATETSVSVPINYGDAVDVNNTIPKGIFQRDFFVSLLKMFNLLVTEDKYKDNHLIITPYVNFWTNQILDWSDKIARDKPIKIKPMSEINARYYNLKYKQDNDYYNEEYRKKYNEGYGDRIYDNGTEFSKDTETLEVIFSSSALYGTNSTDKVFPAIYKKSNENTKEDPMDHNIRIMQIKKITGVTSWSIYNISVNLGSRTDYLYAGHLDDPNNATYDINFGAPQQLYYPFTGGDLSNNLFNYYYSYYMAEITDKDSRLLSAYFKLTDIDIFNLDFSKYIHIDGGLYRINKVIDYTPEANDLTKVELLRLIERPVIEDAPVTTTTTTTSTTSTTTTLPSFTVATSATSAYDACNNAEAPAYTFNVVGGTGAAMCDDVQIRSTYIDTLSAGAHFWTKSGTNVREWQVLLSGGGYLYAIGYGSCATCSSTTTTTTTSTTTTTTTSAGTTTTSTTTSTTTVPTTTTTTTTTTTSPGNAINVASGTTGSTGTACSKAATEVWTAVCYSQTQTTLVNLQYYTYANGTPFNPSGTYSDGNSYGTFNSSGRFTKVGDCI